MKLCSLNQSVNSIGLEQTPIVWQTKQVMSDDSGPISIVYAEIDNLILNNLYSRRNNASFDSNLYQLIFRTPVKVIFDLSDKNNPIFEHHIKLISQPFAISSHSKYFPDNVAKVFLYEVDRISINVSFKK